MKSFLLPTSVLVALPIVSSAATLTGLWEFEDGAALGKATIGGDLTLNGSVTPGVGPTVGDGAGIVARDAHLSVPNLIGANGGSSLGLTNEFTIVMDIRVPDFSDGGADNGNFTGLFEFSGSGSDGDYFIRKQGTTELGVGAVGYVGGAGTFEADVWYRLVYSVDNGTGRSTYLDGSLIGNNNGNNTIDFDRSSLGATFGVFEDNTLSEQSEALIGTLALYDGVLNDQEVAALGVAGDAIPEPSIALLGGLGVLGLMRRRRA